MGQKAGVRMSVQLQISINGKAFHAWLEENPLTSQLIALCPFELKMQERGGHEYYARLPKSFSQKCCRMISKTKRNQISYFDGWNALSFLFRDTDISPYAVAYLGEFEEDAASCLETAGGMVTVRLEKNTELRR
mgnify:CR=1 FL=1